MSHATTRILGLTILFAVGSARAADKPLTGQALADKYGECWQLFNKAQWDDFTKCYGAATVSVAPGQPEAKGATAIVDKHAKPLKGAMPDVNGELQLMLVNGRNAATIALMRGTHTGPLATPAGEIPATRKKIGQLVAHAIESGPAAIAAREWFIQDGGTFMAQLGLSRNPARAAVEKGAAERSVVVATGSAAEKANLAAAKKAYALFNKHDARLADLFEADLVDHDQGSPTDLKGVAAVMEHIGGFWKMSSNVKCTTPVLFAAGDYTVAIGQFSGKNDGDLPAMGLKKTDRSFKLDFVEFFRWRDGKVVEQWPFWNGLQLATQLGLVPAPEKVAAKK
jgi:predicted ester cyclase